MTRNRTLLFFGLAGAVITAASAQEPAPDVVFRSDVSLVRVDVQVLDRANRAVTGLQHADFLLREQGKEREIRNFLAEEMPVDILLLLDVSGSMRSHVQRIADGASSALQVLGREDRIAIMVFDRKTKLRMPFKKSLEAVERELALLLEQEDFDGGTDINRAIYDAARYIQTSARKEARRAIVILTDDQTEFDRDEFAVGNALARADTMLSLLLAPDAMFNSGVGRVPTGGTSGGGGWPSGGGLPDIIFGRRGSRFPGGGGGGNGPVIRSRGTRSAGTAEIARMSGGDSMSVDDAGALERTLSRLRQRYALHFLLPDGARAGEQRNVEVVLAGAARRRYADAELRYRRTYTASESSSTPLPEGAEPTVSSRNPTSTAPDAATSDTSSEEPRLRRRPVNERSGSNGPMVSGSSDGQASKGTQSGSGPGWRRSDGTEPAANAGAQEPPAPEPPRQVQAPKPTVQDASKETQKEAAKEQPASGGWRKLKPGEKP
ncbi:MAG: VWA domain-containing protein [Bryobacterales bacterium]|nr:VWA domain-containing protein [Bryobacterales bacterium]